MSSIDPRICLVENDSRIDPASLPSLVRERGLVVLRSIDRLTPTSFLSLVSMIGTPSLHPFLPRHSDGYDFAVLRRPPDKPKAFIYGGAWHQNLAFLKQPPDITVLAGATIYDSQNYTAFVDLTEVAPWLSGGLTDLLQRSFAIHSTSAPLSPQNAYPKSVLRLESNPADESAVHPCYVTDASTDLSWPFVTSNYVVSLEGWAPAESMPLIEAVYRFAANDEFVIRYYWRSGDIVLWDNRRYMHRATVSHRMGEREIWRADVNLEWGLAGLTRV